ncbi:MAG: hypothetical protein H0T72_12675 [Chloroflexia bacterium]|nr:hypothetical protein [Chloroflexia bacterium]
MSGVSRGHLDRSTQRRFRRIFLIVAAVALLLLTPLILNGDLRLDLAHRGNLVPGSDIEQLAGAGNDMSLIVVPIKAISATGREERRFHAAFLADSAGDRVSLRSLDTDRSVQLPLQEFDFYSASDDGAHVLFQDTRIPEEIEGVLVHVETLETTAMPSSAPWPSSIPGDWETGAWEVSPGSCDGVSPNAMFIACFQNPKLATYIAGDWEIRALVYGDSDQVLPIYRGTGLRPWAGWTKDGSRLYFENEEGIWMASVSLDMFS